MFPDPQASSTSSTRSDPTIAYCQQCGRALTATTRRTVGNGIFCEPCAVARTSVPPPQPGWTPVAGAAGTPGAVPAPASGPNPALAAFLGLIPGVGAMYNGQYAKAAIHLILFVVLQSLAENVADSLGWLVAGWVFYQAFEAYHTAVARRDGLPLPDPFGWNDLGERMGFQRTPAGRAAPAYAAPPPTPPGPPPAPAAGPSADAFVGTPSSPTEAGTPGQADPSTSPFGQVRSVSGFAPAYGPVPPAAAVQPIPDAPASSSTAHPSMQMPYAETFTGPAGAAPDPVAPPLPPARRFPLGALWLIGLGVIFLLGNIAPHWRLSARWVVPLLLGAAALWMGSTRVVNWRERGAALGTVSSLDLLASSLLFPAELLTFSILLAIQTAGGIRLAHSWPMLLIVWGALLLPGRLPRPAATSATMAEDRRSSPTSILG